MTENQDENKRVPFNDAMEHLNKVEGFPISKGGKLPFPIKLIGYFMLGGLILILLGLLVNFLN